MLSIIKPSKRRPHITLKLYTNRCMLERDIIRGDFDNKKKWAVFEVDHTVHTYIL